MTWQVMKLDEWLDMMRDLQMFDAFFTARDATVTFVLSRCRVIDEQVGNPTDPS
jgi:hypothetical protein